jgi:hypothetical protein
VVVKVETIAMELVVAVLVVIAHQPELQAVVLRLSQL